MKLLDNIVKKIVEDSLNKSDMLIDVAKTIESLATQVTKTTEKLIEMSKQINLQNKAIKELFDRQNSLVMALKHDSINMEMPLIKQKPAKPN
jgi:predicted  nucleic acid-binding Zn-ribbon protein